MTLAQADLGDLLGMIPDIQGFRIEEESAILNGADRVWKYLVDLRVRDGWLCVTDQVTLLADDKALIRSDAPPLDGEFLLQGGESLHLRHLGSGRWRVSRMKRVEDRNAIGTIRRFMAEGESTSRLVYEVEWRLVPDAFGEQVFHPFLARYAGLESGGED